ncbi:unnamed protein product [Arabidopsis thaliana]|uniref:Demeter RRM-fold domain-containing protein n=1 Tax=Arabidopsis thaliana TaxID=3702 RepID=A0A5S9XRM4_ARATH|nr:unnamed protein product [Arabidopsis thaliana]
MLVTAKKHEIWMDFGEAPIRFSIQEFSAAMFADHASSLNPIDVPRELIWDLSRRTVFFGTSIPTIFKDSKEAGIQEVR